MSSKFLRRLAFYVGGMVLGSFAVYFLWIRNRTDLPSIWPAGIVKDNLAQSTLVPDTVSACYFACYQINVDSLKNWISKGRVNFPESETRGAENPTYAIDAQLPYRGKIRIRIQLEDSLTHLKSMEVLPNADVNFESCTCP